MRQSKDRSMSSDHFLVEFPIHGLSDMKPCGAVIAEVEFADEAGVSRKTSEIEKITYKIAQDKILRFVPERFGLGPGAAVKSLMRQAGSRPADAIAHSDYPGVFVWKVYRKE